MSHLNLHPKPFKAEDLTKTLVKDAPPLPPMQGVGFGTIFTPHMLIIDFADGAWGKPRIEPFASFSVPPQSSVLHYGLSCFEGMKAYADKDDIAKVASGETLGAHQSIRLFRPEMNIARLQSSMHRLCFPTFDAKEFLSCLEEFVKVEQDYVPKEFGYSLYLRPSAIGLGQTLGACPSTTIRLFVIASPVGPYYPPAEPGGATTLKPVKLLAEESHKRAWPGGTGGSKLGANYAGPMLIQEEAHGKGYDQVLWLGAKNEVQEVGAMNFCVVWKTKEGKKELITAPIDGTILPGVTRDSVLALARQWDEFTVSERAYTIEELVEAAQEGRVVECFGCGTAAIVSPVCALSFRGKEYAVPCPEDSITNRFLNEILSIQYGKTPSNWSVLVKS